MICDTSWDPSSVPQSEHGAADRGARLYHRDIASDDQRKLEGKWPHGRCAPPAETVDARTEDGAQKIIDALSTGKGVYIGVGEGIKHDDGKPRMDLLPWESLQAIADVMSFGADKYGDHNWRVGMRWSRLSAALLRHVSAFIIGQDTDDESGKHHLAHAGCCLLMLLSYTITNNGQDDRYKGKQSNG